VGSQISGPLHISSLFWEAPPPPSYAVYEGGWRGGSFPALRNGGLELKAEGTRPVLVFEGQRYALDSLPFHTPGEHAIDGVRADAALQFTVRHVEGPSAGTAAQRGRQSGTMVLSLLLAAVGGEGIGEAAAAEVQDGFFLDAILQIASRQAFHLGGAGDVPEGAGGTPSPSLDLSHVLSILATQPRENIPGQGETYFGRIAMMSPFFAQPAIYVFTQNMLHKLHPVNWSAAAKNDAGFASRAHVHTPTSSNINSRFTQHMCVPLCWKRHALIPNHARAAPT